jgi:hypothetical protein
MLALLAFLLIDSPADTVLDLVQPYEVRSASGEWRATIDPSSRLGEGPCNVRVERNGELAWEKQWEFTFLECVLADSGSLVGAGYVYEPPEGGIRTALVVNILDQHGRTCFEERAPSLSTDWLRDPENPKFKGLFLDSRRQSVVVRTLVEVNRSLSVHWTHYALDGSGRTEFRDPRQAVEVPSWKKYVLGAVQPPDTGLLLVQLSKLADDKNRGAWFKLLDESGAVVWELDKPWLPALDRESIDGIRQQARPSELAILGCPGPRQFEVGLAADRARVTYEIRAATGPRTWTAVEVARAPWRSSFRFLPPSVTPTPLALVPLEIIELDEWAVFATGRTVVVALHPEPSNTLTEVCWTKPWKYELRSTASKSRTRITRISGLPQDRCIRQWTALSDHRWLAVTNRRRGERASAWIVDGASGVADELTGLPDWIAPQTERLEDGFVALSGGRGSGAEPTLMAFDRCGEPRWQLRAFAAESGEAPLSAPRVEDIVDLAVGPDHTIYLLDSDRAQVHCVDVHGERLSSIELPPATSEDKRRFTQLRAAPDGRLLVLETVQGATPVWRRMTLEGVVLDSFRLHARHDSHVDELNRRLVVDSAGQLWSSISGESARFDAAGLEIRKNWGSMHRTPFPRVTTLQFDELGGLLLFESLTKTVYAFRHSGEFERGFELDPRDRAGVPDRGRFSSRVSTNTRVASRHDGGLTVLDGQGNSRAFDPLGRLVVDERFNYEWAHWLADGSAWVARGNPYGDCVARRLWPDRSVRATVQRDSRGQFFEEIDALAVGPKDHVALLVKGNYERRVQFHDGDGALLQELTLPWMPDSLHTVTSLAWRDPWILIGGRSRKALLISLRDGSIHGLEAPRPISGPMAWTLSPDGREVWCALAEPLSILRFALPE